MKELKLHSLGQNNHLESLKKEYNFLRKKISENQNLSENEKKMELKKLDDSYKSESKNSKSNLY